MKLSFGDFPQQYKKRATSKVALLPIAYDGTSTWKKGADKGPAALLEASQALEWYDRETNSEPFRVGIFTHKIAENFSSPAQMVKTTRNKAKKIFEEGKFFVGIGGEHSVSIGPIYAAASIFSPLTVVQIDAHADLRDKYHGSKYNHACVMARANKVANTVQIGLRSFDLCEYGKMDKSKVFFAEDIYNNNEWIQHAINAIETPNVFLTIDLDGFDPSVLPATGTPEPGGLTWYGTLKFLKALFSEKNIVGFDIVELCPNDFSAPSEFIAAKLVYKLIGYKFFL
jgi:agmatinase